MNKIKKAIIIILALALSVSGLSVSAEYEENDVYYDGPFSFLPGDIDSSGKVDLADVVVLAQYVADWEVYCDEAALDPNGDTVCDLQDVTHLAQYVAEWVGITLSTEEYIPIEEDDDYYYEDYFSENLTVYNSEAPITEEYRGMSGSIYHAFGYMNDDRLGRNYTDAQRKTELDRLDDSGVRFARTRFTTQWAWDNSIGGYNWDAPRMTYYWNYCRDLEKYGISVVQSVGWHLGCFTHLVTGSIDETGYITKSENYPNDVYGETAGYDFSKCKNDEYRRMAKESLRMGYAQAQVLKQAKARGINNITHFLYFTEPSYSTLLTVNMPDSSDPAYGFEGGEPDEYIFIVQTIQSVLKKEGVYDMVQHVGPNQGSIKHGDGLLRYMLERDLIDMFDVWTAHFYPSAMDTADNVYWDISDPVFESYMQPLKDVGAYGNVEFWVDEFYCRADNSKLGVDNAWAGLQNAVCAIAAQQRGINNISLWAIFDQLWIDQTNTGGEFENGIHVCGSAPSLFISDIPRKQYYATGLFAKYNGYKNGKAYRTNNDYLQMMASDIHVGAVQLEDGSWTITVVNAGPDEYKINLSFNKAINQTLYKHSQVVNEIAPTSAAELAKTEKTFPMVSTTLTDIVKPGSVTVYTGVKDN